MSYSTHVHLTVTSTNRSCPICLVPISLSNLPIKHVGLLSTHGHRMATCTHQTQLSHFAHAHRMVIVTRRSCRISLMPIAWSPLHVDHVALWSCPSHGHVYLSIMSHFSHVFLAVTFTHHACRICLIPIVWSNPLIAHDCRISLMSISWCVTSTQRACRISVSHVLLVVSFTHQACRISLMPISWSLELIEHVAFWPCPHRTIMSAHGACCLVIP